jgi:hypothetical protein
MNSQSTTSTLSRMQKPSSGVEQSTMLESADTVTGSSALLQRIMFRDVLFLFTVYLSVVIRYSICTYIYSSERASLSLTLRTLWLVSCYNTCIKFNVLSSAFRDLVCTILSIPAFAASHRGQGRTTQDLKRSATLLHAMH